MSVFLRQLYKQKPQQWGSFDYVQGLLFERAAKIGIDPASIIFALPIWEAAGAILHNYAKGPNIILPANRVAYNADYFESVASTSDVQTTDSILPYETVGDRLFIFCQAFNTDVTNDNVILRREDSFSLSFFGNNLRALIETLGVNSWSSDHDRTISSMSDMHSYCLNWDGAKQYEYQDGVLLGEFVVSSYFANRTQPVYFNSGERASTYSLSGGIKQLIQGTFSVKENVIERLTDNPYYLWQPYLRVAYFVPNGSITIKNISDTGTGSDLISQVVNSLSISDTGTGVDLFGGFNASLSVPDAGSAIDSNPSTSVSFSVLDTGSAVDTITQVLSSLIISDSGSAIDIISQTLISLLIQDSGSGTENLNLLTELLKTVQDVGTGTDSISSPVISLSISDSAGAVDIIDILNSLIVSDLGSASEIINAIKTKFIQIQDSGTASDGLLVSVGVTISDISSATDIIKQVLSSLVILDTGSGTDSVIKTDFNLLPKGIVKVIFSMKVPVVDSSIKVPGVDFTLN